MSHRLQRSFLRCVYTNQQRLSKSIQSFVYCTALASRASLCLSAVKHEKYKLTNKQTNKNTKQLTSQYVKSDQL